jgi:hypothetical protein
MGGVQKNNAILLHEPSIKSLKKTVDQLDHKILQSKNNGTRKNYWFIIVGMLMIKGSSR